MLIAHLSDTHIAGWNKKAYGIAPTAENLAACVEHINHIIPSPDLVLVTGDITYDGRIEEAERAASLLNNLLCPYYIVPGNHDDRSILKDVFGKTASPCQNNNFINYVIEGYDIRLIALDSSIPDGPGGEICEERSSWLDEQLSLEKVKPTIIFMHHPPVKCGVLETDVDGFIGADRLGRILSKYENIERLLCGHIHLDTHLGWQNTVISCAPSMGLQLSLDLTLTRPSEFILEAPGYLLHYFTPEANLVTHSIYVKEIDGPYLFTEYSL